MVGVLLRQRLLSTRGFSTSSTTRSPVSFISAAELAKRLKSSTPPKVLDASWHMPNVSPPRKGFAEFKQRRIPGSAFWDVDVIATRSNEVDGGLDLPHMMPSPERFADACQRLGIAREDEVVVLDALGMFSSPRTAMTFKAFGHPKVSILEGGLPAWEAGEHRIDVSVPIPPNPHALDEHAEKGFGPIMSVLLYDKRPRVESYFIADIEEHFSDYPVVPIEDKAIRSYDDIVANQKASEAKRDVVLDARPAGRFDGTSAEPRPNLSSGHMPHSVNLPSSTLLTPADKGPQTLLPAKELESIFVKSMGEETWKEVKDGKRGVVASCGSGMTAAIVWLALEKAGAEKGRGVYDESWMGYAAREESEIIKS